VTNGGQQDIRQLAVLFPSGEIDFGDVRVGVTTEYKEVRGGVYGYGAYRFELGGEIVEQPVIDWLGESPLRGRRFTYELALVSHEGRHIISCQTVYSEELRPC
jgi:hypothetical protein